MTTSRRRFLLALGATASAGLAGCLGGDADPGDAGPGSEGLPDGEARDDGSTPTQTADEVDAQDRFPDFAWSRLDGAEPVATDRIAMRSFAFHPLVAAVPPGTAVTVTNEDSAGHELSIPALGVDVVLDGGESATFAVDAAGTYDYVCEFHPPDMLGRLVVDGEVTLPTTTG